MPDDDEQEIEIPGEDGKTTKVVVTNVITNKATAKSGGGCLKVIGAAVVILFVLAVIGALIEA